MGAHDKLTARLTLNGWRDKSYNQIGQLYTAIGARNLTTQISPDMLAYPLRAQ